MIVIGSILSIVLISAYIFLGFKISESIVQPDIKIFFWGLYTVTLITLVNISLSIFFYTKISKKKGPLGPRGTKGNMGDKGESGICPNDNECKIKTVQLMVEESIQKFKEEFDITPDERKKICNIVNNSVNKGKIESWILEDLKIFKSKLDDENIYQDNIKNYELDQRIKRQNHGTDNLEWLENLIIDASSELIHKKIDEIEYSEENDCN